MSIQIDETTDLPSFFCIYNANNVTDNLPQLGPSFANMPHAVDRIRHAQHQCQAALRRYAALGYTPEQIEHDMTTVGDFDVDSRNRYIDVNLGFALSLSCADHQALTRYAQTISATEFQVASAIKSVAAYVDVDLLALVRLQAMDTIEWFSGATHYREHLIGVDVVRKDDLAAAKDFLRLFQKDLNAPLDDALAKVPFDENSTVRQWHCGADLIHMTEFFMRFERVLEKFQPYFSTDDSRSVAPKEDVDDPLPCLPRYAEFIQAFTHEIVTKVFWTFERIEEQPPEHLHHLLDRLIVDTGQHVDIQAAYLSHLGINPAAIHDWASRPNREEILIRKLFDKVPEVEYMSMRYGRVQAAKSLLKTLNTDTVLLAIRNNQEALVKAYALLGDKRFIAAMKDTARTHTLEIDLGI